jgi:hypothetical protein
MNEKPGPEPGFSCSTSYWRLDGLRVAPGTEDMPVLWSLPCLPVWYFR